MKFNLIINTFCVKIIVCLVAITTAFMNAVSIIFIILAFNLRASRLQYSCQEKYNSNIITDKPMQLRSIINKQQIGLISSGQSTHELDNEGCKCTLCQKVILKEIKTIKHTEFTDSQSEMTNGTKEQYFIQFLSDYHYMDKLGRKIKIVFPEMCVFEKGSPVCLITKKKQNIPVKIIKNKQKLNAFEIHNFFLDGFMFHNKNENLDMKAHKPFMKKKQHYNYSEILKNECIVLAKFRNGSCQMITPIELNNLFKSKQRSTRTQMLSLSTMVCSSNYNEIRIQIDMDSVDLKLMERVKNEVKIMNQDIKVKDFMYVSEKEESKYEDHLKEKNYRLYLKYISLKMLMLYSLRTDLLLKKCLFKFLKDENSLFYLIDIQVYEKTQAKCIWGLYEVEAKIQERSSPQRNRVRPSSSPERLQRPHIESQENEETMKVGRKGKKTIENKSNSRSNLFECLNLNKR